MSDQRYELHPIGWVESPLVDRALEADRQLLKLRRSCEPYVNGLARALTMPTPPWWHRHAVKDNWQSSPRGVGDAHL